MNKHVKAYYLELAKLSLCMPHGARESHVQLVDRSLFKTMRDYAFLVFVTYLKRLSHKIRIQYRPKVMVDSKFVDLHCFYVKTRKSRIF